MKWRKKFLRMRRTLKKIPEPNIFTPSPPSPPLSFSLSLSGYFKWSVQLYGVRTCRLSEVSHTLLHCFNSCAQYGKLKGNAVCCNFWCIVLLVLKPCHFWELSFMLFWVLDRLKKAISNRLVQTHTDYFCYSQGLYKDRRGNQLKRRVMLYFS